MGDKRWFNYPRSRKSRLLILVRCSSRFLANTRTVGSTSRCFAASLVSSLVTTGASYGNGEARQGYAGSPRIWTTTSKSRDFFRSLSTFSGIVCSSWSSAAWRRSCTVLPCPRSTLIFVTRERLIISNDWPVPCASCTQRFVTLPRICPSKSMRKAWRWGRTAGLVR